MGVSCESMSPVSPCDRSIPLRHAAVLAGLGYLLMPVSIAEFVLMPKLVVSGDLVRTSANLAAHPRHLAAAILCYFLTFVLDILIAWALYLLLVPVHRSLSLLAAWFRLLYIAVGLVALMNLIDLHRLVTATGSAGPVPSQAGLLLADFRSGWSFGLILFGFHLVLVGWLIVRSRYIPWLIGILLILDGLGWIVTGPQAWLYPSAHLGFLSITYFGELIFMLWLLIRGWKIPEPASPETAPMIAGG